MEKKQKSCACTILKRRLEQQGLLQGHLDWGRHKKEGSRQQKSGIWEKWRKAEPCVEQGEIEHSRTLQVTHSWPQLPALRAGESSACSLSY